MGKRPIILATVLGIAFALATLGVLVMQMSRVCMQYQGRVECREALGATEEEALRTAKDNACSLITAGMTQVVECTTRTQPMSMSCE